MNHSTSFDGKYSASNDNIFIVTVVYCLVSSLCHSCLPFFFLRSELQLLKLKITDYGIKMEWYWFIPENKQDRCLWWPFLMCTVIRIQYCILLIHVCTNNVHSTNTLHSAYPHILLIDNLPWVEMPVVSALSVACVTVVICMGISTLGSAFWAFWFTLYKFSYLNNVARLHQFFFQTFA